MLSFKYGVKLHNIKQLNSVRICQICILRSFLTNLAFLHTDPQVEFAYFAAKLNYNPN